MRCLFTRRSSACARSKFLANRFVSVKGITLTACLLPSCLKTFFYLSKLPPVFHRQLPFLDFEMRPFFLNIYNTIFTYSIFYPTKLYWQKGQAASFLTLTYRQFRCTCSRCWIHRFGIPISCTACFLIQINTITTNHRTPRLCHKAEMILHWTKFSKKGLRI